MSLMTGESIDNQTPLPGDGLDAYAAGRSDGPNGHKAVRRRPREEFILGPLPVGWVGRAACLPGLALATAMAIWFRRGIEKADTFSLYPSALQRFGVSRWGAYRALRALENAGLVVVARKRGRAPLVTIIRQPHPQATRGEDPDEGDGPDPVGV
jgi:hypothetical protein